MSGSSFFPSGSSTNDGQRVVPTTPTGRLDDVHLQSANLSGNTLSLVLNDGVTVTADLSTLATDTFATGLAFSSSNRQLTLNRNDGNNFSTTITSAGDGLQSLSLNGTTFILTATLADGSTETVDLSSLAGGGGSTIEINGLEVTDPNFIDTSGSRGIAYQRVGSQVGARANSDDDKQDVLAEGAFVDGDKTKLDGIPLLVAHSNLPRLTEDLVADREYVIWVTNNTGANTNAIDRTAVDIQGQDASTLTGTTVSIIAGRTTPLYVSWNSTTVGDIQNNATLVDPTVTFTSPNVNIRVATGEDATTGGGETYTLARQGNDETTDQATITLTEGTSTAAGSVIIRGQNEIVVGESATDANTILIDYQVIPPIHPENLSISVNPTHLIEVPTGNVSLNATVTLIETGTNWRISGVTNPTASRSGVSFGSSTGIGTQSVSIPVVVTQDALRTTGNISLSFRVNGNNGLPTTDPDYQQYRSVVRNVNIGVSPVWYAAVLTDAPTALSEFGDQRGVFRIGADATLTGAAGGSIYIAIPTDAVDERVRFTTSNPNIFYEFTTANAIGDFSVFNLGTAVSGTYVVRIGGV